MTTKAVFVLWTLWETEYTDALMAVTTHLNDSQRGWFEGRVEATGDVNATLTLSTNAMVLEALFYKHNAGPLFKTASRMTTATLPTARRTNLTRPAAACRANGSLGAHHEVLSRSFEASLNRVVPEHDKQRFFQAFYSTFIHMSPETEQHFSQRSGEGQQMIFKSFSPCWRSTATSSYPIFWNGWHASRARKACVYRRGFCPLAGSDAQNRPRQRSTVR